MCLKSKLGTGDGRGVKGEKERRKGFNLKKLTESMSPFTWRGNVLAVFAVISRIQSMYITVVILIPCYKSYHTDLAQLKIFSGEIKNIAKGNCIRETAHLAPRL